MKIIALNRNGCLAQLSTTEADLIGNPAEGDAVDLARLINRQSELESALEEIKVAKTDTGDASTKIDAVIARLTELTG